MLRKIGRARIGIYGSFGPIRHRNRTYLIPLADQIDQHPTPVSLLNVIEREISSQCGRDDLPDDAKLLLALGDEKEDKEAECHGQGN